jgi:hypothetical protein
MKPIIPETILFENIFLLGANAKFLSSILFPCKRARLFNDGNEHENLHLSFPFVTGVYSETSYRKLDNEYIYMTIE